MDSKGEIRIVEAASMKLVSEITGDRNADYMEMYLNGDSLQVIHQQETYITYRGTVKLSSDDAVRASYSVPVTTVSVDTYDLSDRENPKKDWKLPAGWKLSLIQKKRKQSLSVHLICTGYHGRCRCKSEVYSKNW